MTDWAMTPLLAVIAETNRQQTRQIGESMQNGSYPIGAAASMQKRQRASNLVTLSFRVELEDRLYFKAIAAQRGVLMADLFQELFQQLKPPTSPGDN